MAYSKGIVTIPNVTGDIEITATTVVAEINPIELYSGNASAYTLNKKYSGNSIADGNGYYLTDIIPVDFTVRPYLNIDGAYDGAIGSKPILYKIGFYTGSTLSNVQYLSNFDTDKASLQHAINLSTFAQYDGIQLSIMIGASAMTASQVLTTDQLSVKLSTEALF